MINITLYDSNPHSIIECVDCHVNSTNDGDVNHGQFIRQLKGSKVKGSGPLLTEYFSENFSLCYYCHAEEKVVGVPQGYINSPNHVNLTPISVSTIGTNFRNENISGYNTGSDYPTNIHWNHLDAFGSLPADGMGMYDYDRNGFIKGTWTDGPYDSYQSCPACHNVHGTNYSKMTKNDIAIAYGSDGNGTYGYIGSTNYSLPGGDLYCAQTCHSSTGVVYKYYRNEINLVENCISCHVEGNPGDVNRTAFELGEHLNINTTDGIDQVNNSDCGTCHFNRDMNISNIRQCNYCHTGSAKPDAPAAPIISTHVSGVAITNYSCTDCHRKVIVEPGTGIPNVTSHYLKRPSISSVNYCDYCHGPNPNTLFKATNKTIPEFKHDDPVWNGNSTCRTCHTNSSVMADINATNTSSFHNLTTELGDAFNGTKKADCVICHIDRSPQFVSAPGLPLLHPGVSGMIADDCYGCHGSGSASRAQRIHSVEPSGGGCVACHSNNATRYYANTSLFGRHANLNTSDGADNVTDADCKTCHFDAANITMSSPQGLGAANSSNTYLCDACHTSAGSGPIKPTDPNLIKNGLSHGSTDCKWCHIAGDSLPRPLDETLRYHPNGPRGTAAGKNCITCHVNANLPDLPFHAPGEVHSSDVEDCSYCHNPADNHAVEALNSNTPPSISGLSVTTPVTAGNPVQVQFTVSDDYMQIAAAQYRVHNTSGIVIPWTSMTALDGRFNSAYEVVNTSIETTNLNGTYTINVKGMASAYKTNPGPYYPLNGQWSGIISNQLTVTPATGYSNGTVSGSLGNIAGARISTNTSVSTTTDIYGKYSLSLTNGTYRLTASKDPEYYQNSSVIVTVTAYNTITQDIFLTLKPTGNITGEVTIR